MSDELPDPGAFDPGSDKTEQAELGRRLAFLKLTEDDAERLRRQLPVYEAMAEQFVEAFYQHLFTFDESARFFRDPALVERLKTLQREHFRSMFQADWNDEYAEQRRRVGQTHAERGVEPQFFLAAYTQFLHVYLVHRAGEGRLSQEKAADIDTLLKAVFLDVGLALDAYFQQLTGDLQQALQMLLKANRELRQFAHFTSHDLKTPLGTVANLCEEILDEFGQEIPEEAREMVDSARRTAFRMNTTIDELLSVSLESSHAEVREAVDSQAVVTDAVERVRPMLNRKQIELALPETFPQLRGNAAQLREAFYNLLSNAAKYLDKRPGRIEIAVLRDGAEWIFSVADNGPGIPHEEQEKIFAPFRRLSAHANASGSGLGLYFTKTLIEQQGGRIWVESEPGRGSRFCVALRTALESDSDEG